MLVIFDWSLYINDVELDLLLLFVNDVRLIRLIVELVVILLLVLDFY